MARLADDPLSPRGPLLRLVGAALGAKLAVQTGQHSHARRELDTLLDLAASIDSALAERIPRSER